MTAHARDAGRHGYAGGDYSGSVSGDHWVLDAGERIGAPVRRSRGRVLLRLLIVGALGVGAFGTRDLWLDRIGSLVTSLVESGLDGVAGSGAPSQHDASRELASVEAPSLPTLEKKGLIQADALDAGAAPPVPDRVAGADGAQGDGNAQFAAPEVPADPSDEVKPQPLPPLPPLTDPLQKRAEAVGLHPELSRVLLQRFSANDFRNAGIAVGKAIAETPDGSVLIWPQEAKRGQARFRVHFVPGVTDDCRRYVVTVAWDGWLTTALPMEKCGVPRPKALGKQVPQAKQVKQAKAGRSDE